VVEDLSGVTVDDEDLFGVNYRLRKAQKLKLKQQVTIVSLGSVAGPGCLSRILIFYPSQIQKTAPKEEGENIFFCRSIFCSQKYHKIVNIFEQAKKILIAKTL
jgi:hypothetical protein